VLQGANGKLTGLRASEYKEFKWHDKGLTSVNTDISEQASITNNSVT
jgi:hypothetical protein